MAGNRLNFMPPDIDPLSQPDIRMKHLVGGNRRAIDYADRYSLLTDNSRLRERIEGSAITAPGSRYNDRFKNSGMAPTSFGGGKSSDNPGGYNWDTLNRNLGRLGTGINAVVNYRMESGRLAKAKARTNRVNALQDAAYEDWASSAYQPPKPLFTPANAQSFAPVMTYDKAMDVSAAITNMQSENPFAPGMSLDQAKKTADDIKAQYYGVGPARKQSRNPAVQQPKKKSTAPKISSPKPPGA